MKNLIYPAVFLVLFSCRENSTSTPHEKSTSEDETKTEVRSIDSLQGTLKDLDNIEDINRKHAYITSKIESGSMNSNSFAYNCKDEKNGKIIYFYEEGQLRLIRHIYNEYSHFSATHEYFLKDGTPFFVFYDHLTWNFVTPEQTEENITEKRFYIIDNKPVKCLQKKFTILSDSRDSLKSNLAPNKEIACTSLENVLEEFEFLLNFKDQEEDLECLEK